MRISSLFVASALVVSLGFTSAASAEEESKLSVAADAAIVVPLGDWADFTGIGIGPIIRAGFEIQEKLQVTGRVGYIYHLPKDAGGIDLSTAELLLLGGARYDVGPALIDVATGINKWTVKVGDASNSETRIPLMLGASVPLGKIEVGGSLFIPNLLLTEDGEDMQMGLMATAGYSFL